MLGTIAVTVVEQILVYSDGKTSKTGLYECVLTSNSLCVPVDVPTASSAHWGKAFKMAFTSSATAVSANSNWS